MLNFIICDDEIHMLNRLEQLFNKCFLLHDYDAKIVLKTTNYNDVISYMSCNKVDVVVLDIEFKNSKFNGLKLAEQIRTSNKNCYIIFTTSHMEYVMKAYQFKTFDYLIKNTITLNSLSETLDRLFDDIATTNNKFLKIDKNTYVDINDIQFIEKHSMKLLYHTFHNTYETYNSFSKIKDKLPDNFVRCHKSYIANINNISNISSSDNTIVFKNNSVCYIGPKYKNSFLEMIDYDAVFE